MGERARPHLRWRQAALFVVAMLVPCTVLLILGMKTIEQERQLEDKVLVEARQAIVEQIRRRLLSELDTIKLQQLEQVVAHGGRIDIPLREPVAFMGALREGELLLPWEHASAAEAFRRALNEGAFAKRISEAERLEWVDRRYQEAAAKYRAIVDTTAESAQKTYARLLLAGALKHAGRHSESRAELQAVLASPPTLVDEENVPLGLYAAAALASDDRSRNRVKAWADPALSGDRLLSLAALGMARNLAVTLRADAEASALTSLIRDRERADMLRRDVRKFIPAGQTRESAWVADGDPVWLTGVTRAVGAYDGLVVAVRAEGLLNRVSTAQEPIRLATSADSAGVSLGEPLPGLRLVLPVSEEPRARRQPFLFAGLVVAIAFTLVAGGLLWRDVQRDLRMSEMRSQFVASVSHELRTPLAAIRMFTETLKLDADVDRGTRAEYLDTILYESERLSRLVDNVLDIGRIERGQKVYRFELVPLDDVIEKATRTAQYPLQRAGFTLNVIVEPGAPNVNADADALQQAVLNLLSNAMKYSGDSRRIDVRLDRLNGHARIHVEDQGIGVAPDEQTRVFERFYRSASAETRHIPGAGLGLTIVAHIARGHGGHVEVRSSVGHGSTFTICLPLEQRESVS